MLSDTKLRNLKPREKPYKVADRDGLYVVVTPTGTISFRYNYRLNGRQETLVLGRFESASVNNVGMQNRLNSSLASGAPVGSSLEKVKQSEKLPVGADGGLKIKNNDQIERNGECGALSHDLAQCIAEPCHDPVAIIGIAFRFPGDIGDESSFWNALGLSTISSPGCRPIAGRSMNFGTSSDRNLAGASPSQRGCSRALMSSMLRSSAFRRARLLGSIPNSVCCWNLPGRPWKMQVSRLRPWQAPIAQCM